MFPLFQSMGASPVCHDFSNTTDSGLPPQPDSPPPRPQHWHASPRSSTSKLPEPQGDKAKCTANKIILNCEEASSTLPLVTTPLIKHHCFKKQSRFRSCPRSSSSVVDTGFLKTCKATCPSKPCNVQQRPAHVIFTLLSVSVASDGKIAQFFWTP